MYSFVYLGTEGAGDSNPEITMHHRINIAWDWFGEYRNVLTVLYNDICLWWLAFCGQTEDEAEWSKLKDAVPDNQKIDPSRSSKANPQHY